MISLRQREWFLVGGLLCGSLLGAPRLWAATYTLDKDHTTVSFKVRHLFSKVEGTFNEFEGTVTYVPGHPEQWKARATIQAESIDTRVAERDKHLRSQDFLEVTRFPTITFEAVKFADAAETGAQVHGLLTIRGVQQPVVLRLTIHGEGNDPWGTVRLGFTATTAINRKDFGVTWNKALDTGQLLVGDELDVTIEGEGIRQ